MNETNIPFSTRILDCDTQIERITSEQKAIAARVAQLECANRYHNRLLRIRLLFADVALERIGPLVISIAVGVLVGVVVLELRGGSLLSGGIWGAGISFALALYVLYLPSTASIRKRVAANETKLAALHKDNENKDADLVLQKAELQECRKQCREYLALQAKDPKPLPTPAPIARNAPQPEPEVSRPTTDLATVFATVIVLLFSCLFLGPCIYIAATMKTSSGGSYDYSTQDRQRADERQIDAYNKFQRGERLNDLDIDDLANRRGTQR